MSTYRYTPFGETEAGSPQETVTNPLRFMSREFDASTGLYYVRARWYDPVLGRFVSEDPIGLAGGINNYAYAGNDPVNYRDPSGLLTEVTCDYWVTRDAHGNVVRTVLIPGTCTGDTGSINDRDVKEYERQLQEAREEAREAMARKQSLDHRVKDCSRYGADAVKAGLYPRLFTMASALPKRGM